MYKLTSTLIAGSPVSERSHPVLVSLLEMAAQLPGIERGIFPDATSWESFRKRVQRSWGCVRVSFKAAVLAGITDEQIVSACPHEGLSFTAEGGWKLKPYDPETYRRHVASLIDKAAGIDVADRLPPEALGVLLKAFCKAVVAERALKKALLRAGYTAYASGIDSHVKALLNTRNDIKGDNQP